MEMAFHIARSSTLRLVVTFAIVSGIVHSHAFSHRLGQLNTPLIKTAQADLNVGR